MMDDGFDYASISDWGMVVKELDRLKIENEKMKKMLAKWLWQYDSSSEEDPDNLKLETKRFLK